MNLLDTKNFMGHIPKENKAYLIFVLKMHETLSIFCLFVLSIVFEIPDSNKSRAQDFFDWIYN
jgi:hypothetical protein